MTDSAPSDAKTSSGQKPRRVVLVDGSGFIFRAFHALPPMTSPDGTPVNAVYGFCTMLMKLREDTKPDHMAVIFDPKGKTFRNDFYPEYKAHRPPAPEELVPQFGLIRDATRAFNLPSIELEGYEADDLIATYARQAEAEGSDVIIVSSDKDLMQLVTDRVQMFDAMKNRTIGAAEVMEKFGVSPNKVIDIQALAGDSVDNVPGVPGIGIKTASQLIDEYGDLDSLLERAGEIKQPKRREKLIENAELARISRRLVTLKTDVPVVEQISGFELKEPDAEVLLSFIASHGFKSLLSKVKAKFGGDIEFESPTQPGVGVNKINVEKAEYELVQDEERLKHWIAKAEYAGTVAVDTETTSLDAHQAKLVGISLSTEPGNGCYIPLGHGKSTENSEAKGTQGGFDFGDAEETPAKADIPKQIALDRAIELIKPLLQDTGVLKIGQNLKYDMIVLSRHGIDVAPMDDTMVLSYVLDGTSHGHGMDELADLHLDYQPIKFSEVCGSGKTQITFDQVPLDKALDYAAEDADITLRLHRLLKPRIAQEHMASVYETLDRPLVPVLAKMERLGVKVDTDILKNLSDDFAKRMAILEKTIHEMAGEPFNLGSPKQLGEILFDKMSLPGGKKTKTGAWQTGADVLEGLAALGHDLPTKILEWRQLSKLKSTYTDALANHVNPLTGRVHTSYGQTNVNTGRLSSNDPNLQNIPIRSEEGRKIRTAFVADKGCKLISADYSQIELRLLAHVAEIDALRDAFKNGEDIHAATASKVFGVPIEGMDPMVRRKAKAINFGIIYGISAFGLANQLGIGQKEAKAFIEAYFEIYPGIRDYMDQAKEFAKKHGHVRTLFGRNIHINGINDKNGMRRSFGERAAINAPIQGGAADIIKRAMIAVPGTLVDAGLKTRMLLQVHDELIFEAPEDEAEKAIKIIRDVMENAAHLSVPLIVDAGIGDSWADAH
ncbi:DNA polymerase I [Thalassospira lucentensis]|uniref:DNA polymerase I n=1 Tax=Thalassospira lucentensis TaxID=168935 RepID=UPI0003B3BD1D|nr:DNA polymerase I [Thalassospira lucentensis]RCK29051.1 DNA polymerase [Thalassospira lucentensis MCCC 1A00383 = DSM 14000]